MLKQPSSFVCTADSTLPFAQLAFTVFSLASCFHLHSPAAFGFPHSASAGVENQSPPSNRLRSDLDGREGDQEEAQMERKMPIEREQNCY